MNSRTDIAPSLSAAQVACTVLKGVGPQLAAQLEKLGIRTVQDILFHLPLRYQDRTRIFPIAHLQLGDYGVIEGVIEHSEVRQGRRPSLVCLIRDGSGSLTIRFFHYTTQQVNNLAVGIPLRCYGEVRRGVYGFEMVHPECRRVMSNKMLEVEETLTPIYPSTEGLKQFRWRELSNQALTWLKTHQALTELLPPELLRDYKLPDLITSLNYVHRPPPDANLAQLTAGTHPAQQRLALEELLAHHLSLRKLRQMVQHHAAPPINFSAILHDAFMKRLPYQLTTAQQRVLTEIIADLKKPEPMMRLVQGDVGCGKTVVALLAILQAVEAGYQAALMAPTELLAEQHLKNFRAWVESFNIKVVWLAGKLKGKARKEALENIQSGSAQIIVGTHALFQEQVQFFNLGLIVVDEQHRFGVKQRLELHNKGKNNNHYPHQLVMTATPIPRTLAMLCYADLDYSVIDELPPGRTPVRTVVVPNSRREDVIERVKLACQQKRQAYWVCTLIEESEVLQCQAAEASWEYLKKALPQLAIGLIHGRLSSAEKECIMQEFKLGIIDVLVATTVIEVGVDVPNASLMIIENSERLGLSQLHQLRGRVGRGTAESYCVLLYQNPLSNIARERLAVLRQSNDGFQIARRDLELRGPGEVLGTRQTGLTAFKIADIQRDNHLLSDVRAIAAKLLREHDTCVELLISRWLGEGERFGRV